MKYLVLIGALALAACQTTKQEPEIRIQEVKVPVPVPCPTLQALGPEPVYPDSDAAVRDAPNLYERVRLIAAGRLMRIKRLAEYGVAKSSCQ
jgi:hypothetical protein